MLKQAAEGDLLLEDDSASEPESQSADTAPLQKFNHALSLSQTTGDSKIKTSTDYLESDF